MSEERLSFVDLHNRYERPVVLAFQPTRFRILEDPEELREWEASLVRRVGLKLDAAALEGLKRLGTCCDSECPSIPASGDNLDTDDCDVD